MLKQIISHFYYAGYVECEPPNNRLHKFVGTLTWNDKQYSIDNDKVLLRVSGINEEEKVGEKGRGEGGGRRGGREEGRERRGEGGGRREGREEGREERGRKGEKRGGEGEKEQEKRKGKAEEEGDWGAYSDDTFIYPNHPVGLQVA